MAGVTARIGGVEAPPSGPDRPRSANGHGSLIIAHKKPACLGGGKSVLLISFLLNSQRARVGLVGPNQEGSLGTTGKALPEGRSSRAEYKFPDNGIAEERSGGVLVRRQAICDCALRRRSGKCSTRPKISAARGCEESGCYAGTISKLVAHRRDMRRDLFRRDVLCPFNLRQARAAQTSA